MTGKKFQHLENIIATAHYDETFHLRLLNGNRAQAIACYDLTPEEREALLTIDADTLRTLARELERWMERFA
jgi:hypothetical protein